MKAAGIIRRMDPLGRIVFPSELRHFFRLHKGDPVEIFADDKFIYLRKYEPACIYCGEMKDVIPFKGRNICQSCLDEIKGVENPLR